MAHKLRQLSRKFHLWLALITMLPVLIVIISGILLQVKKQSDWIQPPTQRGAAKQPSIAFSTILDTLKDIPEMKVASWSDVARMDVRPHRGIVKVQANNHWEAQIDTHTGELLQVAYRRSDIIEAIHDGTWFAEAAKLWIFLPAACLLLVIWLTGTVLLYTTLKSKYKKTSQQAIRR